MGSQPRTSMSAANINKQRFESLANKAKVKSEIMEIMPKGFEGAAPVGGWHEMVAFGALLGSILGALFLYKEPLMIWYNTPTPTVADASVAAPVTPPSVDSSADAGVSV